MRQSHPAAKHLTIFIRNRSYFRPSKHRVRSYSHSFGSQNYENILDLYLPSCCTNQHTKNNDIQHENLNASVYNIQYKYFLKEKLTMWMIIRKFLFQTKHDTVISINQTGQALLITDPPPTSSTTLSNIFCSVRKLDQKKKKKKLK